MIQKLKRWTIDHVRFDMGKLLSGICVAAVWLLLSLLGGISGKIIVIVTVTIVALSAFTIVCGPVSEWLRRLAGVGYVAVSAFVTVYATQFVNDANTWVLQTDRILCGMLACVVVYIALLFFLRRLRASVIVGSAFLLLLSTANFFVYRFRGNELIPADLLAFGTAMNVIDQYSLIPTHSIMCGWALLAALAYGSYLFRLPPLKSSIRKGLISSVVLLAAEIVLVCVFNTATADIYIPHFGNGGTWENGYLLNFALSLKQSFVQKPDEYSVEAVEMLAEQYSTDSGNDGDYPAIIAIMNESLADFCVLEDGFCEEYDVLPFYHSLSENTIKGYALSSVFGGKTPNSEFEFLTGCSMAFLPDGSIPYQMYIDQDQYSMVRELNSLGYVCEATHPYEASGWNRPAVYEALGFSKWTFLEDYPQENLLRDYVSDREMYEYVIRQYESRDTSSPWFLFGVTMQNHGGYMYAGDFENTVTVDGYKDVSQYLSVVKESDQALEYLIGYFSQVQEDVVIVLFGDHYPQLDEQFYRERNDGERVSLEEQMELYKVPFLIWANYDIEEEWIPCTSLNYLSNYVYRTAGIALPAYNRFLSEAETVIPAMNALGYYSAENKAFVAFEESDGIEKKYLQFYEILQYNALVDTGEQNAKLFPAAGEAETE